MPVRDVDANVHVEPAMPAKDAGRKRVIAALTNSVLAVAAFLITCIGLHALLPFPEIEGALTEKFRFFSAHKDEFDTVFIGSSRIYFQISPAIFDRVTGENGLPTHSFNFGVSGMFLPESAYLLEQIVKLKPRNLRWLFIECDELQTRWSPENQTSRRALYWADWKRISLLLRKLTDAGTDPVWVPNAPKLRDILLRHGDEKNARSLLSFYVTQFERNYTNVARAADVWDHFLRRDSTERRASYIGAAGDGYVLRAGELSPSRAAEYQHELAAAMAETGTRPLSPYAMEAYRQCARQVRNVGATPIFLITPSTTQAKIAVQSDSRPGVVMAFNDPRAYPNLYRTTARLDAQHLSKSGADEFARIVAAKFVELARTGEIR